MSCFPVIVCIAKLEHDYIEEFVKYHLALGFKRIYLYDNEDVPTYQNLLEKYKEHICVHFYPNNHSHKGVQYMALDHFTMNDMRNSEITHVLHIDIDEFVVLKKHENICDFINEYIVGDTQGIGINWRFFGSSGNTKKTNEPVTSRFTMCQKNGNILIKTLFKKEHFLHYYTCHNVALSSGFIKSTTGDITDGPYCYNINFDVIQLNHYKCKTLEEFRIIRTRKRADVPAHQCAEENPDKDFEAFDFNEVEDLTARDFYLKHCM